MPLSLNVKNVARWAFGCLALTIVACFFGRYELNPSMLRTLIFIALLLLTLGLSVRSPAAAMFFLLLYEPFLGLLRRILIPIAGWGSFDPLVILEPLVVLLLGSYWFYHVFFLREPIVRDSRVFKLLRWMILIDTLEVINPKQGGLTVGYGGLIFYVVPLFWMILSREHFNERWLRRVVGVSFVIGIMAGLYGLKQTYWGYYPFEEEWLKIINVIAMNVDGKVRAVSLMTNSQEYSGYLGLAMVFGWYYVLRGSWPLKLFGLAGNGLMGWALFMESTRGGIITTMLAIAMMTLFSARRLHSRIILVIVLSAILTGIFIGIGHIHSNNGLIAHDVAGLSNPLNGKDSSFSGHTTTMWSGILRGLKMPIGYGLGSTTTAAGKFSSDNAGTEVDISNMFVSNGAVGGFLYLILMANVLFHAFRQAHRGTKIGLIAVGVLCSAAGQWVNGELYSEAALVWIVIGQVERSTVLADTLIRTQRRFSLRKGGQDNDIASLSSSRASF